MASRKMTGVLFKRVTDVVGNGMGKFTRSRGVVQVSKAARSAVQEESVGVADKKVVENVFAKVDKPPQNIKKATAASPWGKEQVRQSMRESSWQQLFH